MFVVSFPVFVYGSPFLVCDPYPSNTVQPTSFIVTMDNVDIETQADVLIPTGVRLHYELKTLSNGNHTVKIRAKNNQGLSNPTSQYRIRRTGKNFSISKI